MVFHQVVTKNRQDIDRLLGDMKANEARMKSLQAKEAADIKNLYADLKKNDARIASLQGQIAARDATIARLQQPFTLQVQRF